MELKKSYRGFVLMLLLFVAGMAAIILLPTEDGGLLTWLLMGWTGLFVALLAFVVWRTEQVYWYNGTEYEDAVKAGSERRNSLPGGISVCLAGTRWITLRSPVCCT